MQLVLASLRCCEGDRLAAGTIALPVKDIDSEAILGERFQPRHYGVRVIACEDQKLLLSMNFCRSQQAFCSPQMHLKERDKEIEIRKVRERKWGGGG